MGAVPDIIALGDVNVDIIAHYDKFPAEGEDAIARSIEVHCGGSAANTARALARLGFGVGLISRLGQDPWAATALHSLNESGILLTGLQRDQATPTGLIYVIVTPDGERTMLNYRGANANTAPEQIREEDMQGARLFHLSGYALLTEPQRSAALLALDMARRLGLIVTLDPGLAPATMGGTRALLSRIDVLLPTLAEAQALTGHVAADDCARALLGEGIGAVVVKLGKEGCLVFSRDQPFRVPGFSVFPRDSTGAGDCFDAGIIAAHLGGLGWHAAALLANAMGALVAVQVGAQTKAIRPPQLLSFLQSYRDDPALRPHTPALEEVTAFLSSRSCS